MRQRRGALCAVHCGMQLSGVRIAQMFRSRANFKEAKLSRNYSMFTRSPVFTSPVCSTRAYTRDQPGCFFCRIRLKLKAASMSKRRYSRT